jgi:hypothetical protein
MHASELLELAAIVSAEGPVLVEGPGVLSASSLEQYWTASQCRFDRWAGVFKQLSAEASNPAEDWAMRWPVYRATLEEVLTSEVLTRVFGAVVTAYDAHRKSDQAEPIARSVMVGHLEARNRVLRHLVSGPGMNAEEGLRLDRLRRRSERWTDMLVGYLHGMVDVRQFAIDPDRAVDFGEDLNYRQRSTTCSQALALIQTSLRAAFRTANSLPTPNADLNERIATSVLACFRADLFDATGTLRSLWMTRLCNGAADVHGMLDDLLEDVACSASRQEEEAADRFLERLRRFNGS